MTKQKKAPATITLGDKTFNADKLSKLGTDIMNDLAKVDGVIAEQNLLVSISNVARGKLIEELTKESVNFEEVKETE